MESKEMIMQKEPQAKVTPVNPMGYGNPDSKISHEKKLKSGELLAEVDAVSQEYIKSKKALVEVHEHDDGCIDGRCSLGIIIPEEEARALSDDEVDLFVDEEGNFYFAYKKSESGNHERAKLAGGGIITGLAVRLGIGMRGETIEGDVAALGADLVKKEIFSGAHTGKHLGGEATDCGANDKFQLIIENAVNLHSENIKESVKSLFEMIGVSFNEETYQRVIASWTDALSNPDYFKGSTGKSRLDVIRATQDAVNAQTEGTEKRAVTKHLNGEHNEAYIVMNFVKGHTFSQNALLDFLREKFPNLADEDLPQAFVVDAWRVVDVASASADDETQEDALYSGVMFQFATAATLTDGTLKTFVYTEE